MECKNFTGKKLCMDYAGQASFICSLSSWDIQDYQKLSTYFLWSASNSESCWHFYVNEKVRATRSPHPSTITCRHYFREEDFGSFFQKSCSCLSCRTCHHILSECHKSLTILSGYGSYSWEKIKSRILDVEESFLAREEVVLLICDRFLRLELQLHF